MNTSKAKEFLKKQAQKIRLIYLASLDIRRFSRNAAFSMFDDKYEQLTARIMYNVHAIEKGLSHETHFRAGFGKKALSTLNDTLVIYEQAGYSKEHYPYVQGLAIYQRYKEAHEKLNEDTSFLKEIVNEKFLESASVVKETAGLRKVTLEEKSNNFEKSFYELAQGRVSVREFSGEPIDVTKVYRAIENAEKTPSVCNRQGWSVYLIQEKNLIKKVLFHQRGFKGYGHLPEVLLAITVSNNTFLSPVERNEAFVDGGLFSMSVLYGLEYESLASVPLNAMMNSKDEKAIRKIIDIEDSEQIIMFIAIGQFKNESYVPKSDRKNHSTFIKER